MISIESFIGLPIEYEFFLIEKNDSFINIFLRRYLI